MEPEINLDRIVAALEQELQTEQLARSFNQLRGLDWNPFDEDEDEFIGPFAEMNHNLELIWDFALDVVHLAERARLGARKLTSPEKHKVVVEILDDAVRLPWYAEMFDGPAFDVLVKVAVGYLNAVGWIRTVLDAPMSQDDTVDIQAKYDANPSRKETRRIFKRPGS